MPHVSSSGGGDDLGSEDEVKVFKDEGEDEKRSSENLTEEKSSLIDLTESEVRRQALVTVSNSTNWSCRVQQRIVVSVSSSFIRLFVRDSLRTSALSACMCVAGKGLARRWKLRDDGQDVDEIRSQPCFR